VTEDAFRALCLALPEVVEGFNMGSTYFKANGKDLARLLSGERVMLTGVPIEEIEMLVEADPGTFWTNDHYKPARCLVAHLRPLGPDVARSFLERRFRQIAKKAVVQAWEAGR
jgi:hypothetical protein